MIGRGGIGGLGLLLGMVSRHEVVCLADTSVIGLVYIGKLILLVWVTRYL